MITTENLYFTHSAQNAFAKLLVKIAKFRKKFSEIEGENAKISELRKKVAEVETENAKLRQIIEENTRHNVRVEKLEQKNTELKTRLTIIEQNSMTVDGQLKNNKKVIAKLPASSSCIYLDVKLKFENKVKIITTDGKIKDKIARTMIYKKMLQYLTNITQDNLRIQTHRAKKFLMLFGEKEIRIDKIKLVTCNANDISKLNNTQIQNIIDYMNDQIHVILKTITNGNGQSYMTLSEMISLVTSQISRANLTYNHAYFRNKTLDQYPNLYREFSSEDFDYFGLSMRKYAYYAS
ncbi:hypothetical protein C1645_734294 [Glomus cerebriforme]|uniref:Uncharacterized protein n=1 Tax=Glomus cerebriforme TaxID=658196 RepID=A0A397TCR9_9GLOM|nr:hypothetical protein C1645_734294 [Glomus cerebriforme]